MKTERIAKVRVSPKGEILTFCVTCPISPSRLGFSQRSACIHGWVKLVNGSSQTGMDRFCDFYERGSIKNLEDGVNTILCNQQ